MSKVSILNTTNGTISIGSKIVLTPGANEVDAADWEKVSSFRVLRAKFRSKDLIVENMTPIEIVTKLQDVPGSTTSDGEDEDKGDGENVEEPSETTPGTSSRKKGKSKKEKKSTIGDPEDRLKDEENGESN